MAAPKVFKWPVPAAGSGSGKEEPAEVKKKRGRPRKDVGEAAKPADAASFFLPASARQKLQKREFVAVGPQAEEEKIVSDLAFVPTTKRKGKGSSREKTADGGLPKQAQGASFFLPVSARQKLQKKEVVATDAHVEEEKIVLDPAFVPSTKRKGKESKHKTAVAKGGKVDGAEGGLPKQKQGARLFASTSARQKLEKKEVLTVDEETEEEKVVSDLDFVPTTKRKVKRIRKETVVVKGRKIGGVNGGLPKRAQVAKVEIADDYGKEAPRHLPVCLRTESRLAAEENARLNAGRRLHPFFQRQIPVSGKLGKLESDPCPPFSKLEIDPSPPLHVTQSEHAEAVQLNWGGISFVETCCEKFESSDLCEMPAGFVLCRTERSPLPAMDQVLGEFSNSFFVPDEKVEYGDCQGCSAEQLEDQLLKYMQSTDNGVWLREDGSGSSFSRESVRTRASLLRACRVSRDSVENGDRTDVGNSGTNSLWTDIYQPKCPEGVCGNSKEVGFLDTWLETWQKKILSGKRSSGKGKVRLHEDGDDDDDDKGWFQDDSDSDADSSLVEDDGLENTLLLTGPVGSGKTAAVYACALKQGFSVIESNTADLRNGSLIRQKFGVASELQGLQRYSGLQSAAGPPAGVCDAPEPQFRAPSASDSSSIYPADDTNRVGGRSRKLTVFLFEDVDIIFEQDWGFFGALVKMVARTKRPIILTSNKRCPSVPPELRKLRREFKQPCTRTLVVQACMAAHAEGVACCPQLMECVIKECQHDMRQVLMLLQFWSQGRNSPSGLSCRSGIFSRDKNGLAGHCSGNDAYLLEGCRNSENLRTPEQGTNWPLKTRALGCDLQQQLRPLLLPLSFPCSLSQHVAGKISEAVRQLHLCAAFAGTLSSAQVQEVTSFQDKEESVGEPAGASAPRVAVCVSPAKSVRLLRALARSGQGCQGASNTSGAAEIAKCLNKQEAGCVGEESCESQLMPLHIGQSGKTVCWGKAPAQSLGIDQVCVNAMGRSMKAAHVRSTDCEYDDFQPTPPAPTRRRLILRLKIPPELQNSDTVNGAPPARRKRRLCEKIEKEETGCQQVGFPAPTVVADAEICIVSGDRVSGVVNRADTHRANSGDNRLGSGINVEPVETLTGGLEMQNLFQNSGNRFFVGDAVTDLTSWENEEASRNEPQAAGLHPQPVILSVHSALGEQVSDIVNCMSTDRASSGNDCLGLGINGESVETRTGGMEMQSLSQVSCKDLIVENAFRDLTSLDCEEVSRDFSQATGLYPQPVILSVQSASTTRNANPDVPCSEYRLSASTHAAQVATVIVDEKPSTREHCRLENCRDSRHQSPRLAAMECTHGGANLITHDDLDAPDVEANKNLIQSPVFDTHMAAEEKGFDSAAFPPCEDVYPLVSIALSSQQMEFDEAVLNTLRATCATSGEDMDESSVALGKPVDFVSQPALSLSRTTARLTDVMAIFDIISSYSVWEGAGRLWGFHLNSLEDKGAYLADLAVQLCLGHCSDLLQLGTKRKLAVNSTDTLQGLQRDLQLVPGTFDWLRTDANPCDPDHNLRKKARWGMLKGTVLNLVPARIHAAVTGSSLHDYSMTLARITKLEHRRQKTALAETGLGSRRSGRGFLHHFTNSIAEDSIAGLLSHSMFERGVSITPWMNQNQSRC